MVLTLVSVQKVKRYFFQWRQRKSPSIDPTTGNWVVYEWNEEKQEYVGTDTGISAKELVLM